MPFNIFFEFFIFRHILLLEKQQWATYGDAHSPLSLDSDSRFHVYFRPPNFQTTPAQVTTH